MLLLWTVIKCPSLSHPLNGYLLRHDVSYNTTVSFGCNPGYRLKKHWTITCLISGQWSGASPHCECKYSSVGEFRRHNLFASFLI